MGFISTLHLYAQPKILPNKQKLHFQPLASGSGHRLVPNTTSFIIRRCYSRSKRLVVMAAYGTDGGARRRVYRQSQSEQPLSTAPVKQISSFVVPAGFCVAAAFVLWKLALKLLTPKPSRLSSVENKSPSQGVKWSFAPGTNLLSGFAAKVDKQSKETLNEFAKELRAFSSVDMSGRNFGDEGLFFLAESLGYNQVVEEVSFAANGITATGIKAFDDVLQANIVLKTLNLSGNPIGDEGVKSLCDILVNNASIQKLQLNSVDLGDEGAKAISELLKKNSTLRVLELNNNMVDYSGFTSLAGALLENNTIRNLHLNGNYGGVLARRRNPLLVGVCAYDALASFTEILEKKNDGFLGKEISGLNIICIEKYILKCINEGFNKGEADLKFEEMGRVIEREMGGSGVVVNYGDLQIFVSDKCKDDDDNDDDKAVDEEDGVGYLVGQLTRLLQVYGGKVWVLGAATSYQTYLKFLSRFPSVEKHWDLQILPITSLRNSLPESYPKSSLMESFVPFGGFFSTPSELKGSLSSSYQHVPRCHLCNERCEQEVVAISKGGFNVSVADQYQSTLPPWLQMTELCANKGVDMKTKDDGGLLNTKVAGLQKKWDNICQRLHHTHPVPESNTYQANPSVPTVVGFHFIQDKKEDAHGHSSNNTNTLPNENNCINVNSCSPVNFQKMSTSQLDNPSSAVSKTKNGSLLSKLQEKPSKAGDFEAIEPISPCSLSNSSVGDGSQTSPTSVTSVTTDLGLGLCSVSSSNKLLKPTTQNRTGLAQDFSGCLPANIDLINGSVSGHPAQSSSSSSTDFGGLLDPSNFKKLFTAVTERVGWQDEAASVICQTVANSRARNEKCHGASRRGDIWLNFSGPDRCGKMKIAVALADIIYGSREKFICMDLSAQDGVTHRHLLFNCQEVNYDLRFRGKTVVDYVAEELSKKPWSVVFLENVDKADIQVQSCLSQAIQIGKFSDSHGREVSINNAIFVTTSTLTKENQVVCHKAQTSNFSEDKILRAKGWPLQILIKHQDNTIGQDLRVPVTTRKSISKQGFLNKRKLIGSHDTVEQHETMEMAKRANRTSSWNLDLNIPAEESEVQETDDGTVDNDTIAENPTPWLQDFFGQPVKNVVFKPFDFDALAEKVLNDIDQSFRKFIRSECLLEIDSKVMEQLLAAAYLSDEYRVVTDWVGQVLSRGFAEVEKKYNLNTHSVVKLVPGEDLPSVKTLGVGLPPQIILK